MSVTATVGAVETGASLVGEIPGLGDLLQDIPVIGGIFGGGPEDMDASEVEGKLYAGRWEDLDDEMEPRSVSGARSDVSELMDRMNRSGEIRQLVNGFAREFIHELRSQGLIQSETRSPNAGRESARVVVWVMRGGAGSSWDQGPVGESPARQVFNTPVPEPEPEPSASASTSGSGGMGGVPLPVLIAGGAALGLVLAGR